jgi:PAS domain-containing protein
MKTLIFSRLRSLMAGIGRLFEPKRKGEQTVTHENWKIDEIKEIDGVVETFNCLVAQICGDGSHLGDLYTAGERNTARHALLSETIVDAITSGIVVVEATGGVSLVNSAARGILGIDAHQEIGSRRLGAMLADASELEALVSECLRTPANASRRLVSVKTRAGRSLKLGASISCLYSTPTKADAVIVIFTELRDTAAAGGTVSGAWEGSRPDRFPNYLRGVLDSYDHFSSVVREIERVQVKLDKGALTSSDVAECVAATRRAWETMTAYALSLVAPESLTELVDPAVVVRSVLARKKELAEIDVRGVSEGLPLVKTVGKVLEAGLELLFLGCRADASGQVAVTVGLTQGSQGDAVEIKVSEHARRASVKPVGTYLRDFSPEQDLRREAGLMLLGALPADNHRIQVAEEGNTLGFSVMIMVPINRGAGPTAPRSDSSEKGPDRA